METPDPTTLPPISEICNFLRSAHSYYERFDFPESAETTDSRFESILEDDSNFLDVGDFSCAFENTDNNQALVQNDAIHWLDNIQISNCDGNLSYDYKWNTETEIPTPDQSVVCGEIFQPIGPESAPIRVWNEKFGPMSETGTETHFVIDRIAMSLTDWLADQWPLSNFRQLAFRLE